MAAACPAWHRLNRRLPPTVDGRRARARREQKSIYLYQTLVGAWPIDAGRLRSYVLKAAREAKVRTSLRVSPNQRYDDALARFAEALVEACGGRASSCATSGNFRRA